ncbi:lipid A-modifier LpxR family protein [Thalassorhabdomicrobium marinisediminis]|nr:lipid A-modifier LpxR family protein [Thalassorhabdomicrobium marinisediminis]
MGETMGLGWKGVITTCALCWVAASTAQAEAQDRALLGIGRLFTNDFFADHRDRWRTGSYSYSIVHGRPWSGARPQVPGAVLEYRLRSEIIAPARLNGAGSNDRAYVGALSAGLHTHYSHGALDISAGVDLVATGPQTGMLDLQDAFHDQISAPSISDRVRDRQVGDDVHPTALVELSSPVALNDRTSLRPFLEAQYGVETLLRVGADVLIGPMLQQDLWLRDVPTGQLYTGVDHGKAGTGFVLGADYARVSDSAYFPASFGTRAKDERFRARAGLHWRFGDGISYFYGVTYLSEEFEGQPEGQIVGSLKLNFNF